MQYSPGVVYGCFGDQYSVELLYGEPSPKFQYALVPGVELFTKCTGALIGKVSIGMIEKLAVGTAYAVTIPESTVVPTQPFISVQVIATVYTPEALKQCEGEAKLEVSPSPKS